MAPNRSSNVVLVKQEQLHDAPRKARDATKLTGIDRVNDVHDLGRRDAHNIEERVHRRDLLAVELGVGWRRTSPHSRKMWRSWRRRAGKLCSIALGSERGAFDPACAYDPKVSDA